MAALLFSLNEVRMGLPALNAVNQVFNDKYDFYVGLDGTSGGNKFLGASRYWTREDGIDSLRQT